MTPDQIYQKWEEVEGKRSQCNNMVDYAKIERASTRYYNMLRKAFATEQAFKAYWDSKGSNTILIKEQAK